MTTLKIILIIAALGVFSGCTTVPADETSGSSTNSTLSKNRKIAGADGKITITTTSTNSNKLELYVKHMGAPNRFNPRARNYIVWEVPKGFSMKPQNLGPMKLDKNYVGRFTTITAFRSFDIFITAEAVTNPIQPTSEKLLWTTVDQ